MKIVKLIRHRHRYEHFINDIRKDIEEEIHFKVIFPDKVEKAFFEAWIKEKGGSYKWDAETNKVAPESELPDLGDELEGQDKCWCSVITYYLSRQTAFEWHSFIPPNVEIFKK